jgi:Tfp pilus assembly protein PilX
MKTTARTIRGKQGYALIITLTFLGIMLMLFATMMYYTVSNGNLTRRNNQFNASEAAAEAATERVLSQMTHDFEYQSLTNSGTYYGTSFLPTSLQSNWPVQYTYSNPSNNTSGQIGVYMGSWTTNLQTLNAQYTGLRGLEQNVTITATATPNTGPAVPATVTETIQFAYIPLFQFAIFYNMNLEIAAASPLTIQGPVYSNGGIWSGSTAITFSSSVSAVGLATNAAADPFCPGYSGSGPSTYSMVGQPTSGNDTLTMPVGTSNNAASVEAIVNIPPTTYTMNTASAFSTNGQLYIANAADLYLTNYPSGTNWSATLGPVGAPMALYYSDGFNVGNYLTWVTNDFYVVSNFYHGASAGVFVTNYIPPTATNYPSSVFQAANGFQFTNGVTRIIYTNLTAPWQGTNYVVYMGYSFLTNVVFYDWREGWHNGSGPAKTVQAVQLNLVAYNQWMTNHGPVATANHDPNGGTNYNLQCNSHKSHPMDSMYVYNAVPLTTTTLPAARVMNGAQMPSQTGTFGFTFASAMPLYVWGDYNASNSFGSSMGQNNVTYTEPAALMGDSITILSDGWNDSVSSTKKTGGQNALQTTINAACLEGIVESTNNAASDANGYSGGVENFLRLQENWSSINLYYNGSIIVMFPSQYATNCWQQTGNYYTAATRKWAFDTNYLVGSGLPPLTPKATGVIRGTWNAQ